MNVVDSSGWLEYFASGPNADFFASAIEETSALIVPTISLYEVLKHFLVHRNEQDGLQAIALMQQGQIVGLTPGLAVEAARTSHQLKLPMADSVILTTARMYGALLWTQDADFSGIPGIRFKAKVRNRVEKK